MADLINVSEYKLYKGINSDNDLDTIISLIPAISTFIKSYCGTSFIDYKTNPKTEYWSEGGSYVFLKEFPVDTITSVKESTDNQVTSTLLVENTDFYVDYTKGYIISANGVCFPEKINAVEVIYTGGYTQVPSDIKLAAYHILDYYRNKEYIQRKSLGSHTIETLEIDSMSGHITRLLDPYKINI